jgi:hypothetical protein
MFHRDLNLILGDLDYYYMLMLPKDLILDKINIIIFIQTAKDKFGP